MRFTLFPHFADTDKNVLPNTVAIKNNKEVLLASDMVKDKIPSCADD